VLAPTTMKYALSRVVPIDKHQNLVCESNKLMYNDMNFRY